MLRVGLTGGIGAGKSEVSRQLAALGAVVLDADLAAREVVEPGTVGLARIAGEFGPGVLRPGGSLDRAGLAAIVFGDSAALGRLNTIVHPLIIDWMRAADAAAASGDAGQVIVHDVPLLAEGLVTGEYDLVVVVDVAPRVQIDRLVRDRGMTADQARARVAAQATRDQRLTIADVVIDNSGTLADLNRCVDELWKQWRARASG